MPHAGALPHLRWPALRQPACHPIHRIREISGPALINTLIDPILSLIDTLFVGRLGSSLALGARAAHMAGPLKP